MAFPVLWHMLFRICPFRQWLFLSLPVSGTVLGPRVEQLSLCNTHNCIASLGKNCKDENSWLFSGWNLTPPLPLNFSLA